MASYLLEQLSKFSSFPISPITSSAVDKYAFAILLG